jgi:gp19
LEEEKRQRRNFEKASLVLLFLSLVLLAVVAAGALRFGAVSSERDSEQARAQSNGTAARGLASHVKRVCASGGQESVRLYRSGLCVDAQRVERSVQGVPGPAGVRGPQGPAGANGRDGVDGSAGPIGPQGPQGSAGADGVNGRDGKDGKDGRSVVSVYCSGGRLMVKYSDGGVSTVSGSVACQDVKPSPVVTVSSHK